MVEYRTLACTPFLIANTLSLCVVFFVFRHLHLTQRRRALELDLDKLATARKQVKEREAALSSEAKSVEVSQRWVELFFYPARADTTRQDGHVVDFFRPN